MTDEDDYPHVVIPRDLQTPKADGRGRIHIGPNYADKRVRVAILDVIEEGDDQ